MAARLKVREQHIAVFGGPGSGKTVLLSSFYGDAKEHPDDLFDLIADDTGQGQRLRSNYLRMKKSAEAPAKTRFSSVPYGFTLMRRGEVGPGTAKAHPFDTLRLVWHDYPGEWFEEAPDSEKVAADRVATFRSLLQSDVAFVLVDGQKLLDYEGEEEKYLKSLFWSLKDGLAALKDDILDDGKPLTRFPRIWMVALSKADLHPGLDARDLQDLVIEKAADDLESLRETLRGFVELPDALSVGEDFVLLSSAKFEPGAIDVSERVGLDLILPIASLLPLQRLARWSEKYDIPRKWLGLLAGNAEDLAVVLLDSKTLQKLLGKVPKVGSLMQKVGPQAIALAVKWGGEKLVDAHDKAVANHDYLQSVLTRFQLDLDEGEDGRVLVRSQA